ncbi:MAG: hypothetical protein R3F65_10565 [bacterium]
MKRLTLTALLALFTLTCTPPPQAPGDEVAPAAAQCVKTGQQCRLGGSNALGVCHQTPETGAWSCTPQH